MNKRVLLNVGGLACSNGQRSFLQHEDGEEENDAGHADHENDGEERELSLIHRDTPSSCEIFLVLRKGVRGLSRIYLSGTLEMCNNLIIQIMIVLK